MEKVNLTKMSLFFNNLKTKYELLEAYNGTFGVMDSIKNVTIPTKGD
jgi:hypothetical protein